MNSVWELTAVRMTCRHAENKYTQTDAEVLLFVSVYMKATILQSYVQQRGSLPIVVYSSVDSTFFLFIGWTVRRTVKRQ